MKTNVDTDLLEKEVLGLRVWMIIGIVGLALTIVGKLLWKLIAISCACVESTFPLKYFFSRPVVILCCVFDCRIPRSKAEIEAEHENTLLIKKYKDTIEGIPKGKKVKVIKGI